MTKKLLVWFDEVGKEDVGLVGGKGANLGEMLKNGFPVPNGFIVTAEAYRLFIKENNLQTKIKHLLEPVDYNNPKSIDKASKAIKKVIVSGKIDKELVNEIFKYYKKLGATFKDALVAVRSSATAEDLPNASFAGQQATYLNVKGEANLIIAIKDAWASLFEARAIFYRHDQKFDHFKVNIAVPVQKMVASEKSGVMFSISPVTNDKTKIIIEAIYGLGEYIVQGTVTPDHYEVDKKSLKVLEKQVVNQKIELTKKGKVTKEEKVSKSLQDRQKITDKEILKLAALSRKLEKHYYFPQDSEWAIEKGRVYLVQTRPVTTTANTKASQNENLTVNMPLLLKGSPASPGISSGSVKILKSAKEISKIKEGDVLVAPQTNPDFVPAMKKAVAIVTDFGGRTCFTGDTKVLTDTGFLSMQDIYYKLQNREDLKIYSYDYFKKKPKWKNIVSAQKNRLPVISVSVSQTGKMHGNIINTTNDHKFFTFKGRKLIKKPINEILLNNDSTCLVDYLPKSKSSLKVGTKLSYLLGAFCTDGNIHLQMGKYKWRRGTLTFTQKDSYEKQDFIQTVNSTFTDIYNKQLIAREKYSHSYIGGRLITGYAKDYRCYSLKIALEIKKLIDDLPLLACSFSENEALHFIAGVIDGDGSFSNNRIQIYASKSNVYEAILISCLRLGIMPQITTNRNIYSIQILERMTKILQYSKKINTMPKEKILGNKLFAAKQIFEGVENEINYKGRIKPYINNNLLIDSRKIRSYILPMVSNALKSDLTTLINSSLRMQRVKKEKELGVKEVYNIEVGAENELDHNYIVFTSRYTPILVSNSHAAIVSREIGIPAVVGTQNATKKLKDGEMITVNGTVGEVYKGVVAKGSTQQVKEEIIKTATKVYVNLAEPEFADRVAKRQVDGVGLLRAEFMMAGIGVHPKKMIREGKSKEYVEKLADGLYKFCKSFSPRPVVYRASDFKTNEYRELVGGKAFEPAESNPMLGYRGAYRYIHDSEVFKLELEAIKKVRGKMGLKNLWLMLPFVRNVAELKEVKKIIADNNLYQSSTFKLWMMVEIPSNVILIDKFLEEGLDGVSIGSNDLTMLILGTDRDNSEIAPEFDEQNDAVLWALEKVIKTCNKYNVTSSICGQAPSTYPELLEKLVKWGITSVSIAPDVIYQTRENISRIEKEIKK